MVTDDYAIMYAPSAQPTRRGEHRRLCQQAQSCSMTGFASSISSNERPPPPGKRFSRSRVLQVVRMVLESCGIQVSKVESRMIRICARTERRVSNSCLFPLRVYICKICSANSVGGQGMQEENWSW